MKTPRTIASFLVGTLLITPVSFALEQFAIELPGAELIIIRIEPGCFIMGSDAGDGDERPVHKVTIDYSFEMGRTEVTVGQFAAFVKASGYKTDAEKYGGVFHCPCPDKLGYAHQANWRQTDWERTDEHPVTCVSYNDAAAFCKWLSQQTGENFRLPTEAEWEYACRAGRTEDGAAELEPSAWFNMTSPGHPCPVAQKSPNPWGLHDMMGNVWEWCEDVYHWTYRGAPNDGSANSRFLIPAEAAVRLVTRGGSWCSPRSKCTPSYRRPAHPGFTETGTGFRVVRCDRAAGAIASAKKSTRAKTNGNEGQDKLTLKADAVEFEFVRIEPGRFVMGNDSNYIDQYGWKYEFDKHDVTIGRAYYLAATEVTVEQFSCFVEETGYSTDAEKYGFVFTCMPEGSPWHYEMLEDWLFPGFIQTDDEPVTHVTWYDAVAFCVWLSEKMGREIRLPSEAEWEYACRAGSSGHYAGSLGQMGWFQWNGQFRTHPVAQKKPNGWGLYDMHGNVWEWVADLWTPEAKDAPDDGSANVNSPRFDVPGVTRGGSFGNPAWLCASHTRMRTCLGPRAHYNNGFRIAMSVRK